MNPVKLELVRVDMRIVIENNPFDLEVVRGDMRIVIENDKQ